MPINTKDAETSPYRDQNEYLEHLSVDYVIFGVVENALHFITLEMDVEPCAGQLALPGGLVHVSESLENASERILGDLTGVRDIFLEQLFTFGEVERYPLKRVITVAYYALINPEDYNLQAGNNVRKISWNKVSEAPTMPFDHGEILEAAHKRLKSKVRYEPIGFELLPRKFTLTELQKLYEEILGLELDKRNFRKKILKMDFLVALNERQTGVSHRAARYYRFDKRKYNKLQEMGFHFDL
ncbi:MAG: hypothetical protein OCD01_01750 [Fibrobacterales bacterium]